ncbi:carboxypeptidase-like regulatory domain-containing protein [Maioricimonas sp. JC845]|uniref:carboxypeptidase-like regulatory domain-containing protein n=1 Tax=Maioricimonas sp. JC845 TaxID=3232138 RepID=UPI00345A53E4
MDLRRAKFLMLAALLLPVVTGCSGGTSEGRVKVYPVSGKVTMGGGPLVNATVAFAPHDGQPTAVGRTDVNGEYHLSTYGGDDGAAAGSYSVVITKPLGGGGGGGAAAEAHGTDPTASYDVGGGHGAGGGASTAGAVPERYSNSNETPLSATVTADGENRFDFEIEL